MPQGIDFPNVKIVCTAGLPTTVVEALQRGGRTIRIGDEDALFGLAANRVPNKSSRRTLGVINRKIRRVDSKCRVLEHSIVSLPNEYIPTSTNWVLKVKTS
jgi:superfamily II DNA/RNA helicase